MSYIKRFFEDIAEMIGAGMKDEDIAEQVSKMYGVTNDDWVLKQINGAREQLREAED